METVVITGGTGLIGKALNEMLLAQGYSVINFSRTASQKNAAPPQPGKAQDIFWDPGKQEIDPSSIGLADYIINLAGAGVADKRWTQSRKEEIVRSRVASGHLIVKALNEYSNKVQLVINASGIGWYGADPQIPNPHPFTEDAPADPDFLGDTCVKWENSVAGVRSLHKRLVIFRTGIVLSKKGGALKEFLQPLKFGLATVLGTGKQVMSWIHINDICRLYLYAIQTKKINGVYNAVAPLPVSNKELIMRVARARKKFFLPVRVPSFVLKTMLGELSIEVLKSATVSARKIIDEGFVFQFPNVGQAVEREIGDGG